MPLVAVEHIAKIGGEAESHGPVSFRLGLALGAWWIGPFDFGVGVEPVQGFPGLGLGYRGHQPVLLLQEIAKFLGFVEAGVEAGDDDLPALGVEDEVGDVAGLRAVVGGGQQLSLGRWRQVGLPGAAVDEAQVGFWIFGGYLFVGFPGWACSVDGFCGHFRFTLPFLFSWDWVGRGFRVPGPGWVIKLVLPGRFPVVVDPGLRPPAVGGCRAGTRGASLPG